MRGNGLGIVNDKEKGGKVAVGAGQSCDQLDYN